VDHKASTLHAIFTNFVERYMLLAVCACLSPQDTIHVTNSDASRETQSQVDTACMLLAGEHYVQLSLAQLMLPQQLW
jgi:hypothetical protein